KENTNGNIYNLVGFQTSLKFGEQKRVFGIIPALKNAEFVRYGVMHRNSFVNAPKVLNNTFALKSHSNIYIAGQLSGLEGYMESIMSGLIAGINMAQFLCHKPTLEFDNTTMMGALTDYITKPNSNYTPMNANFGILPPIENIRDKQIRKKAYSQRALLSLRNTIQNTNILK
ncbi:MAG: FAD-dependent oxidoreductase, partial [Firmicutes bacterium]|nr:FAD-dependent oxidoreductase [Bacillota bacterium]